MKFLLDQDVSLATARFLSAHGHEVLLVPKNSQACVPDDELLKKAQKRGRIFVTGDRDFGNLAFIQGIGAGVICLRALPGTRNAVHLELERVLSAYAEVELKRAFIRVEPRGHRLRWLMDKVK